MKFIVIFIYILHLFATSEPLNLKDIGKSATDVAKGIIEKIPDAIPKPDDIFQAGKNLIAGYPFEQVFSAINTFCKRFNYKYLLHIIIEFNIFKVRLHFLQKLLVHVHYQILVT